MMKLLHCHIENFGKIHNEDFDFKDGITQFYQENGYGKTTLAAFLKAMFYGLPSYKSTTTKFNDRMHFYPFNGGKFGGNLTFEMGGKQYRIERFFDKKSDTADELKVFCAGRPHDFHTEPGKAVFGLDKESFERTAFFTEADSELTATSAIGEKLNRFVEGTQDEVGFDGAVDALEKARKALKKRGGGGRMDELDHDVVELTREIENLEQISDSLSVHYTRRNALQEEISAAQAKIKAAGEKNLVAEKWKHLQSLLERREKLAAQANQIRENYGAGVPAHEELARAKQELGKVKSLREFKKNFTFADEKIEKLQEYERVFREGVPNANKLEQIKNRLDEAQRLKIKLSASESGKDERFLRLEQKFAGNLPDEKKEREISKTVEKYRALQQSALPVSAAPKKKRPLYLVLALIAVAFAAAGVGLLFVNTIAGGVLLGVGVIALGVVAFLYLKSQTAATQSAESVKHAALLKEAEDAVREFLVPYGYYSQNGIVFDFSSFLKDKEEYLEARRARRTNLSELGALKERYEALNAELQNFFRRYRIHDEDLASALVTLRQNLKDFASLQAQEREFEEKQSASQRDIEKSLEFVKRLYEKYALNETPTLEHVEQMSADRAELARLDKEIATIGREAEEYRNANQLADIPPMEETSAAPMSERLHEAQRELAAVERQITDAEAYAEKLMDKRAQKEALEEELARLKVRYEVMTAALDALQDADRNLKDKYVAPVKDAFLEIAKEIEFALGERMSMDADFRITFERGGERRSDKYLSAGQRSVCALAFRLALIRNMYEEEQPFLVLDDPFTALDENHFEKTAQTLKVLSQKMQIIYFCCHKSRTV